MLDNDEGIAEVAKPNEGVDEPLVIALVEPDRWLIEHIQNSHEARANLSREADALRLSPGQGSGGTREVEVVQSHVDEEAEPCVDFAENLVGNHEVARGELDALEEGLRLANRKIRELGDRLSTDGDGQDFGAKPATLARGARRVPHELLVAFAGPIGFGVLVTALEVVHDSLKACRIAALAPEPVAVAHVHFEIVSVEKSVLGVVREILPRRVHRETKLARKGTHHLLVVVGAAEGPRRNRPFRERRRFIRDHEVRVDFKSRADTRTFGTRAVGGVKGERPRLDFLELERVLVGARALLRKSARALGRALLFIHEVSDDNAVCKPRRGFHRVR